MNTLLYNNIEIKPAPQISIEPYISYANNNVIGYRYSITLTGKAIDDDPSFPSTLNRISFIKSTLSTNGSVLLLKDSDNNELIKAVGGILTNLEFQKTSNAWSRYTDYTATIKFNEVSILGETFDCNNNVFPSTSFSSSLVNLNAFKLKDFSDEWTFNISDEVYNFESDITNIINTQISVQYDISASAENYFTDNGEVIAGWQQSKNFVQQRLFEQIGAFKNKKILPLHGPISCEPSSTLPDLHNLGNNGLISTLSSYNICNETVSCSTSESEGNFSATYNAILKYNDSSSDYGGKLATHKVNKNITHDTQGQKKNVTIRIDGTIEGLNSGNSSNTFGGFTLPENGQLLISGNNFDKYANALVVKNKVVYNDEDLQPNFKQDMGITFDVLFPSGVPPCISGNIVPTSFNVTTNEFLGTINYSATYTTDKAIAKDEDGTIITKTTIEVESPNHVYVEFPIPNGNYVIQDLDTFTSKKVKVSVDARLKATKCCRDFGTDSIHNTSLTDIENEMESYSLPNPTGDMIRTNKSMNFNFLDKTYTLNVDYICKKGCPI